jgi:hypothetical protein
MIDNAEKPAVERKLAPNAEEPSQLNQVDDAPAVETPVEARQGFLGRPVAMVLGVSLVLAVLAGILVGFIPL